MKNLIIVEDIIILVFIFKSGEGGYININFS